MLQLEVLFKKATLSPESPFENEEENKFSPSTLISLPILSRATAVNNTSLQDLSSDPLKSEICADSANPEYNFSTKFNYNNIQQLCNDLLLSNTSNCTIINKDDTIFGSIHMQWKQWIISAISNRKSANWTFSLPILDQQKDEVTKGEINLEIIFRSQSPQNENISDENNEKKQEIAWQNVNFFDLIPKKHSYLFIKCNHIKYIPKEWYPTKDDAANHLITISFDVNCADHYNEKVSFDVTLQVNDDENNTKDEELLNKEWMFFVDADALNYYLAKSQNKESFDIQFEHILAEKDKKKGVIRKVEDKYCLSLSLRPFTRPGIATLSDTQHTIEWVTNDDTATKSCTQSTIEIELRFSAPLITPYTKPIPPASDLLKESEIRSNHEKVNRNKTKIKSKIKFQAIIAAIQAEIKDQYLRVCTTYNDMTQPQRKATFMKYLLSSTHCQRLTNIISQVTAAVAEEEMYSEPQLTTEELTMKLRAKLESLCKSVFDDAIHRMNVKRIQQNADINERPSSNKIEAFLPSTNIDNIYAEPLRDMNTVKTMIVIAFLNEDYTNAYKWIVQAMAICTDQELLSELYLKLAFVTNQIQSDPLMAYHCINHSLSIQESKEILYAKVMVLCEKDKLEEAEPFMNKLMDAFPNDPYVQTLKGIFEYLMEEVEDAQNIWKTQSNAIQQRKQNKIDEEKNEVESDKEAMETEYTINVITDQNKEKAGEIRDKKEYDLNDLWLYPIRVALKFDCQQMIETILKIAKSLFEIDDEYKIDYVLLQHHVLIYNKQYETALSQLGQAILINDHDVRVWLHIGSTYYLLNKLSNSIEAFQRHIDECNDQHMTPNLMAMIRLIEIYLMCHQNKNSDEEYLNSALSLIKVCQLRIECLQIYTEDSLNILVCFDIGDKSFIDALKYKLWSIQAQYFDAANDTASALTHYAYASSIHPLDKKLWIKIESICNGFKQNYMHSAAK